MQKRRKRFAAMPETIKKKQKNFRELKLQHLRNKFAQLIQKAKIKLIYEKVEHFHKECRQIDVQN